MNKGPKSSGVVRPNVKVTPRLSASVAGTRIKKNAADELGRHPKMAGSAKC